MMNIGIGIPTYNRIESLKITIRNIQEYCELPYDLFVSVDGSTDGTKKWLQKQKIEYNWHGNIGIAGTRNYIVERFKNYDDFFIIEDDVRVLKAGVFSLYLRAKKLFGIHHFNFLTPYQRKASSTKQVEDLSVMFSVLVGGCFSTYTSEVVKRVGFFNPDFKGYGHEHCEYTLRVSRVGLTTGWNQFAHLVNAEEYLLHEETVPKQIDPALTLNINNSILQRTLNDPSIVYIPWQRDNNEEELCVAIGHRGKEDRYENLVAIIAYYRRMLPRAEIFLVEQDIQKTEKVVSLEAKFNVKYVFAYNPFLFNRSWTFNIVARQTNRSIMMCCDNDIVLDENTVRHAASKKIGSKEFDVYIPYCHFYDTTPVIRNEFIRTLRHDRWRGLSIRGYHLTGGCVFVSRETLFKCSFNEKFMGWGGEDDEFFERAQKLGIKVGRPLDGYNLDLYHLYHDRNINATNQNSHYSDNVNELLKIRGMRAEELCNYNQEISSNVGLLNKYQES